MPKRFTDTEKWRKKFIKNLSPEYKLFWFYLLDDCDYAGIWHVDFEIAQIRIGMEIDQSEVRKIFKEKIIEFDDNEKWFLPDFIDFQYGELNENNRAHASVIRILKKYKLYKNKEHISPLEGAKEKDKDKEQDKDKDKEKEIFDEARKIYPGNKRGLDTEFSNFKKHKDWGKCIILLKEAIDSQIKWREKAKLAGNKFIPEWKNFKTWINQRCWEEELEKIKKAPEQYDFIHKKGEEFFQHLGQDKQPE